MTTGNKIRFIRVVLWIGIILDGVSAILYVFPKVMLAPLGFPKTMLNPVTIYLLFHAGVFMLAWTILLVWVLKNPIARRFILLLTVLVTAGISASALYLLTVEGIAIPGVIPLLILPVVAGSLFTAAYIASRKIKDVGRAATTTAMASVFNDTKQGWKTP